MYLYSFQEWVYMADAKRISTAQPKISVPFSGFIKTKSIGIRKVVKPIYHESILFLPASCLPYMVVLQHSNIQWYFPYV